MKSPTMLHPDEYADLIARHPEYAERPDLFQMIQPLPLTAPPPVEHTGNDAAPDHPEGNRPGRA